MINRIQNKQHFLSYLSGFVTSDFPAKIFPVVPPLASCSTNIKHIEVPFNLQVGTCCVNLSLPRNLFIDNSNK